MPEEVRGVTCELRPSISVILNMLEPMILPNAISVFRFTAAAIEAANSGNDVPHAISVSEIKASFTPNDLAIVTALSTKRSQLIISRVRPPTTLAIATHIEPCSVHSSAGVACFLSREKEYHIKKAKSESSSMPSKRLIVAAVPLKKFSARRVKMPDTPMQSGISNFKFLRSIATGKNIAVIPKMPKMLKIF